MITSIHKIHQIRPGVKKLLTSYLPPGKNLLFIEAFVKDGGEKPLVAFRHCHSAKKVMK